MIEINNIDKNINKNKLDWLLENFEKIKYSTPIVKQPKIILIGEYHKSKRNKLTRLWGYDYLKLAIDDNFIKTQIDLDKKNFQSNQAIFTSRTDRNSEQLIKIWQNKIFPHKENIQLLITPTPNMKNLDKFNIFYRKMKDQLDLINDLKNSRVMLVPGHKAELFCLAAEEARELCIPIITLGIGSLKERVLHNETGFIANNDTQFAKYTLDIFNDNDLYMQIKKNLYKLRNKNNWLQSTKDFLRVLNKWKKKF